MIKVPELRFVGFDGEWEEEKFSEKFDTTIPKNSLSRDKLTNKVTKVKNIHYGDIHKIFDNIIQSSDEKIPYIINDDLSTHERYFLQDGDIIFTDAAEDNTAGKCVELDIDDGSNIVAGLHTIPARPIKFGKYFYGFYLNSNSFHNKIIPLLEGTKVSSISKTNLNTLSVIVPKVEEQEKIGDLFKKLDALIEIQEGKVSNMEDFKKSMLQKMFPKRGELVPDFRFDGFDGNWESTKLSYISKRVNRRNLENQSKLPLTISSEFGLVNQLDYYNNRVASKDISNYYLIINGEFAYNKSTSLGAPYGAIKRLDNYENGALSTLYIVFEIVENNLDFMKYYFETSLWHKEIYKVSQEGARNHGLLNITTNDFFSMRIKLPSLEEQDKIGQFFKNLDTQIKNEQNLLDSYKMMKKSLLQKMFV